jgi:tetratricopeptide (TPR) repeat protein
VVEFRGTHAAIVLIAIVIAGFSPIRENGFVSLDDKKNFLENTSFRGLGWDQIVWAWTSCRLGVYEPLGWMALEAEYTAFGLDPRGYHTTSLALYTLVTLALYTLAVAVAARARRDLARAQPGVVRASACLAVALYAVHPLRAQLVAWASCQSYVLCGLLLVLTVLAYLRAHGEPPEDRGQGTGDRGQGTGDRAQETGVRNSAYLQELGSVPRACSGWMAICVVLYALALLSKAPAITLPAVLLVLDVYPLRRLGSRCWHGSEAARVYREKLPFIVLSVIFAALAVWARYSTMVPGSGHTAEERIARACYNALFYLVKTVAPAGISAHYPVPLKMTFAEPRFYLSAAAIAAVSLALVALRRRYRGALAVWCLYLVMLAPSSGLVRAGGTYVAADRYCFLPMMPLVVLAAGVFCSILGRPLARRAVAPIVFFSGAAIVIGLVTATRDQCRIWRDSKSLWGNAVAVSDEPNPFANHGLALVLLGEPGGMARAETLLADAMRTLPNEPILHNAMTTVLARTGRSDQALAHAREALRLAPDNVHARVNFGNLLALRGDPAGAKAAFSAALRIDPNNADAHGNLGLMLKVEGRMAEAEAHLAAAVRQNPGLSQARRALDEIRRRRESPPG